MRFRYSVLWAALALACSDDPAPAADFCGALRRVDTPSGSYCACPEGTTETAEGCLRADGSVIPLPGPDPVDPPPSEPPPPDPPPTDPPTLTTAPILAVDDLEGEWTFTEVLLAAADSTAQPGDLGHDPLEGSNGRASLRLNLSRSERGVVGMRAAEYGLAEAEPVLFIPILEHLDATRTDEGWAIENVRKDWDAHTHVRLDFNALESTLRFDTVASSLQPARLTPIPGDDTEWTAPTLRRFACPGPETADCSPIEAAQVGAFADGILTGISSLRRATALPAKCDESPCDPQELWTRVFLLRQPEDNEYLPAPRSQYPNAELETVSVAAIDLSLDEHDPRRGGEAMIVRHDFFERWLARDASGALRIEAGAPVPLSPSELVPRRLQWALDPATPAHLIRPALEAFAHWNEGLARAWRSARGEAQPVYPEMSCQTDDPMGYCYCADGDGGAPIVATCPGRYRPEIATSQALADGAVSPIDCTVEVPEGAEPNVDASLADDAFALWRNARLSGSECYVTLTLADPSSDPAFLGTGDPRAPVLHFEPGDSSLAPSPDRSLAFADISGDPVTGQATATSLRLGGGVLNELADLAEAWRSTYLGEPVVGTGDIEQPGLVRPPSVAAPALHAGEIVDVLARDGIAQRLIEASNAGAATAATDERGLSVLRRRMLHDTFFESEVLESDVAAYFAGTERFADATPSLRQAHSPIRRTIGEQLARFRDATLRAVDGGQLVSEASDAWDPTLALLVETTSASGFRFAVERRLSRRALLWAVGRALGLAPNFGASSDAPNHPAERWSIANAVAVPPAPDVSEPTDSLEPHRRAFDEVLLTRDRAGFAAAASSSVLDLPRSLVLDAEGLGPYDRYALAYATFGLGELWDDSRTPDGETRPALGADSVHSGNTLRAAIREFPGGQACGADSDCPWSSSGARASELTQANLDAGILQRCDANVCTDSSAAIPAADWLPVVHRSCSVDELETEAYGWCAAWDTGGDARSVLRDRALRLEQTWVVRTRRLGRERFTPGHHRAELLRIIDPALRVTRPAFEGGTALGRFGGEQALLAGADLVNLMTRMLAGPNASGLGDSGLSAQRLEPVDEPTVTLPVGLAHPALSVYDEGLQSIGQVQEALFAAEVLTARDLFAGRSTALRDGYPEEVDYGLQGGLRAPRADTFVGPWLDCGTACDTSTVQHIDLFVGFCDDPIVPGECLFPRVRRLALTPIATDNPELARWTWLLAASQLARSADTSVDRRWAICNELERMCPVAPESFVQGLEFSQVLDYFAVESAFTAFGKIGEALDRSAAARRVQGATVSMQLVIVLGKYVGRFPEIPPSIGNLTPEEQAFLSGIGFVLPPPMIAEATLVRDAVIAETRSLMEAIEWRALLGAYLGLIENTATELERSVPAGTCRDDQEDEFCRTDDDKLGLCHSESCLEYQP